MRWRTRFDPMNPAPPVTTDPTEQKKGIAEEGDIALMATV